MVVSDDMLLDLLQGVRLCFCLMCCHRRSFGYCAFCRCHNHIRGLLS